MRKLRNVSKMLIIISVFVMIVTATGIAAPLHKHALAAATVTLSYRDNIPGSSASVPYTASPVTSFTFISNSFVYAGYRFIGWNLYQNGSGTMYQPGDVYRLGVSTKEINWNVYAQWEKVVVAAYDPNSAAAVGSVVDPTEYIAGENILLQTNGFSRTGYLFTGWNTSASGTGTQVAEGASYTVTSADSSNGLTFYAQWKMVEEAIPKTGDSNHWTMLITFGIISFAICVSMLVLTRRIKTQFKI